MVRPGEYKPGMSLTFVYSLSALAALLPAAVFTVRRASARPEPLFWLLLAVALVGSASYGFAQASAGWNAAFAQALWLSITVTLAVFLVLARLADEAWRLARLLLPYLSGLAVLAVLGGSASGALPPGSAGAAAGGWLLVHIVLSLVTYAFVTLAAIAAVAVVLQERALKARTPSDFLRSLPSIADAERLEVRLLAGAEAVLFLGILTGIAQALASGDALMPLDHKTIFVLLAFVMIAVVLALRLRSGLRGRGAARIALVAYLFLTLAYPGVKFVTDVIIGAA